MDKNNIVNKRNYTYWRIPELGNLEIKSAEYQTDYFPPHFHEEFAIGLFMKGTHKKYYQHKKHIIPECSEIHEKQ